VNLKGLRGNRQPLLFLGIFMRRNGYLAWHRRLVLAFAPLLLLQALTGAVLLFHEPLARWLDPVASSAPALPISAIVSGAQAHGGSVDRLFLPDQAGHPALAQMTAADGTTRYAAVDPASGLILREGGLWAFPLEAALQWHYRLMSGTVGLALVALGGVVLALLSGTGLAFWWPAKGRWNKSLTINPKMPARVRLRHWHRNGGVLASVLLLFSAITGFLLSAPDVPRAWTSATPALPYRATPAQIDAAVALGQQQFPDAALRDIRFPWTDRIDINFHAPQRNARAVHVASVRLSRAEVLKAVPADRNDALWMKVLPLHTGDSFGVAGTILLLIEALVLTALAVTGPWMWWQGRKFSGKSRK
jgi:uncharacterized iron-regulated membrane protein